MRLRILELPAEVDGDTVRTPFVLVVDDVGTLSPEQAAGMQGSLQDATPARGVLVFQERVALE